MEARDASGNVVEAGHVEVITAGPAFALALVGATLLGVAGALLALGLDAALMRWTFGALAVFVGVVGLGSIAFTLWGKYPGFGWHFTP